MAKVVGTDLSANLLFKNSLILGIPLAIAATIALNYFALESISQLRTHYANQVSQREWELFLATTPWVWIRYKSLFDACLVALIGVISTAVYFAPINRNRERSIRRYVQGLTVAVGIPLLIYSVAKYAINNTGGLGGCPVAHMERMQSITTN